MSSKKLQLPKSVLEMKFMRKTKERIEKELQNTQGHESLYSNIITDEMRHASGNFITESSFIFCEDLLEGRLSYKGMNPEIERLMEQDFRNANPDEDMKKDVSDETLMKKMEQFNRTKKRSYQTPNKKHVSKKRKF